MEFLRLDRLLRPAAALRGGRPPARATDGEAGHPPARLLRATARERVRVRVLSMRADAHVWRRGCMGPCCSGGWRPLVEPRKRMEPKEGDRTMDLQNARQKHTNTQKSSKNNHKKKHVANSFRSSPGMKTFLLDLGKLG